MANVTLRKMWFAPGGQRWREGQYLDFPEQLLPFLPSSAVINDGSGPMQAGEWLENRKAKKGEAKVEDFVPNTQMTADVGLSDPGNPADNTGPVGDDPNASAGQGEGEGTASPKSSGPDTTALSSVNKEGQATTASGTTPKQKAEQAAAAAAVAKK